MDLGPGADDVLDPGDLDDIRARVVLPVVTGLLTADELVSVDVVRRRAAAPLSPADVPPGTGVYFSVLAITYAPPGGDTQDRDEEDPDDARVDELWVVLEARDDEHGEWLVHSPYGPQQGTLGDAASQLADQMTDWVCETRFGWGQLREPELTIPNRDASGRYSPS
jgi:hypothetical protein